MWGNLFNPGTSKNYAHFITVIGIRKKVLANLYWENRPKINNSSKLIVRLPKEQIIMPDRVVNHCHPSIFLRLLHLYIRR